MYCGDDTVLSIVKRHKFSICLFGTFCVFCLIALHYYANGQAIASAHLEGHSSMAFINGLLAIVMAFILVVTVIVKRQKEIYKWFSIPAIIFGFALIHIYIGSLFDCCVCCCMPRHVHQWNAVIAAIVITILLIGFFIIRQLKSSTSL